MAEASSSVIGLYWGYIGIMEKKMETTILWGYIVVILGLFYFGITEKKMEATLVYWGYIRITENKMETTEIILWII